MKKIFLCITILAAFVSCTPSWVRELESKNPLKDSTDYISVYFRFDTIVNGYEVSGILYPLYTEKYGWNDSENGVRLFFHDLKTGKEYVWTDWSEKYQTFDWLFMSQNVDNIVSNKKFKGFKNGDSYIFTYNDFRYDGADNMLYPYAEYQFYDADFDGEDELLIGFYRGGPYCGTCYDIYDITDSALVRKKPDDTAFIIDINTVFDSINKTIITYFHGGANIWGNYYYQVNEDGDFRRVKEVHHCFDIEEVKTY